MAIKVKVNGAYVSITNVYVKKNFTYSVVNGVYVKVGGIYAGITPVDPGGLGGNFTPQFATNGGAIFA